MKALLKKIIKKIPIAFTKNQQYDRDTQKIIKQICNAHSNCIDVGCHKGEILDVILKYAPQGNHTAFEPIPISYNTLCKKYASHKNVTIYNYAVSNLAGKHSFNYVITNPSYSGLIKRNYDKPNEKDTSIEVNTISLDYFFDSNTPIHFIKIDVEGGELQVFEGAATIIQTYKPIVIFEHGLGGSDCYDTTPLKVFNILQQYGLQVNILTGWLKGTHAFTLADFEKQFYEKINFCFIAYPAL
jgi:FkbM family methyltransferase